MLPCNVPQVPSDKASDNELGTFMVKLAEALVNCAQEKWSLIEFIKNPKAGKQDER
jgi:hypothetical protein